MPSFHQILSSASPALSFEFFPPKSEEKLSSTRELMEHLTSFYPDFMTVTYGAGGGTRGFTKDLVGYIHNDLQIPSVSHLTCVGHSKAEIDGILEELSEIGISHILALRGDPPAGEDAFEPHPEGFQSARDLTEHISATKRFSLATAGYPEMHKEAQSLDAELAYLKSKVTAGAEVIITQLFFDPEVYLRFKDRAEQKGIHVPILPGIMPISNVSQVERFTTMCGASIPSKLKNRLHKFAEEKEAVIEIGTEYATRQIETLLKEGAPGLHVYTLNKKGQVSEILNNLGFKEKRSRSAL